MGRTGNWDSTFSRRDALDIADAFRRQMRSLGEDDKTIEAHMLPWHKSNLRELLQPVHVLAGEYSQLQTQETTRESFNFPHDAPANDENRLANEARTAQNTAFIVSVNQLWGGDEFAYVSTIESVILDSPCGAEVERRMLLSKVKLPLDSARYYAENFDFKSRESWISAQSSQLLKGWS